MLLRYKSLFAVSQCTRYASSHSILRSFRSHVSSTSSSTSNPGATTVGSVAPAFRLPVDTLTTSTSFKPSRARSPSSFNAKSNSSASITHPKALPINLSSFTSVPTSPVTRSFVRSTYSSSLSSSSLSSSLYSSLNRIASSPSTPFMSSSSIIQHSLQRRALHIKQLFGEPSRKAYDFMAKLRYINFFGYQFEYSWSILAGHFSFGVMAISFILKDIMWLRAVACGAGLLSCAFTYFHPHGRVLWLPFGWNVAFIIINLLHIFYYLYEESQASNLTEEERDLMNSVFDCTGISSVDFLKLVRAGRWEELPVGHYITKEGNANSKVHLISRGRANVTVRGENVYVLEAFSFIGEMGLHVGLHISTPLISSATVSVLEPVRVLSWSRATLIELLEQNPSLEHSIQAAITADLVRKLKANTFVHHEENSLGQLLEKSNLEYANLLRYVVQKGEVSNHERNILHRYRNIHYIKQEVHDKLLAQLGWHQKEFALGRKLSAADLQELLDPKPKVPEHSLPVTADGRIISKTAHPFGY